MTDDTESTALHDQREALFEALLRDLARTPATILPRQATDGFANGRYRVTRVLGRGGQKLVYLVHDTRLKRPCALSILQPGAFDPAQLERFRQEAEALARFGSHPNVVTIYDLGEEDGLPYVLCEFVDGGDLRTLIEGNERLPVVRVLGIARDICRALAFAHEHGVVHRDVTPANIWLMRDGTVKLGDFGLALATGGARLSAPGAVLGTAAYLAPEQALGKAVDGRSDLYALGCVLYELFTGVPPFVGDSPLEVVSQQVHADPVPPDAQNPELGPKLGALVLRLIAKDPDDRPASARALLVELERMLAASPEALTGKGASLPIPGNERDRLTALHALGLLDTQPEAPYDEMAALAAGVRKCPLGYVCFVDETRQWMKTNYGFPPELASLPREIGACQTTICQSEIVVSPDLAEDPRFRDLPPVTHPPHLRFYCGAPLITAEGHALGTLVVMDFRPRELSREQLETVRRLSRQVVTQLELLRTSKELTRRRRELESVRREADAARNRADELLSRLVPEALLDRAGVARRARTPGRLSVAALAWLQPRRGAARRSRPRRRISRARVGPGRSRREWCASGTRTRCPPPRPRP